jgi:5-methylcytosine-specific restriction endonuclease McrA
MQVDHIISQENFKRDILHKEVFVPEFLKHLTLEDVNHIDNLIATCRSCNNYKSAYTLENFRRELGLQLERLNKNTNYKLASRY